MTTTLETPVIRVGNVPGNATVEIEVPECLSITEDPTPPKGCGVLKILTKDDGDKRVVWDSAVMQEIHAAKAMFDRLVQEGLVPYLVGNGGKATDQVMQKFDPTAEEILFLPVQMVAGG